MQAFWDIATPLTWGLLTISGLLLLTGFILLSHTLVRSKAYGDGYSGLLAPGRLEWTVRGGMASLLAGFGLWAYVLDAPVWTLALLGGAAVVAAGMEVAARLRG